MREVKAIPRDARRLLWVLAGIALAMGPHVSHLPMLAILLIAVAGLWRLSAQLRGWPLPARWLRILLAMIVFSGVFVTYRTLNGLQAGTALLAVMAGVKLMETRTVRDLSVLIFLSYFLLFAAFLYDQSLLQLPFMLLATWVLTATLLRIHQAETASGIKDALWSTARMLLLAAPVTALLFLLFPRLPGNFWAVPPREAARTGLSDEMTPGDVSELTISAAIAFRVHFEGPLPPPRERYWRGPVLHDFDGRTWRRSRTIHLPPQDIEAYGPGYNYRITLEPHQQRWIFALDTVTQWPEQQAIRTFDTQLLSRQPVAVPRSFTLRSHTSYRTTASPPTSVARLDTSLSLNRNPRAHSLALQLRSQAGSDETYVDALLQKFRRENFYYTLQPPTLAADAVDDFLFNTRRGFCEHFASAFTMMMRAAGIPARVVTGYQGGDFNPVGGYLIVRQSDAHAWSEVWLGGRGWVRVDPTAAVAPERVERGLEFALDASEPVPRRLLRQSRWLTQILHSWDAVHTYWNDRIVEFDAEQQRKLLSWVGIADLDWRRIGVALVVVFAGFFIALAIALDWQYSRRDIDPAARIYERLCRRLARHALPRKYYEGPRDYLARVAKAKPALAAEIENFARLYLAVRYGPSAAIALRQLKKAARAIAL